VVVNFDSTTGMVGEEIFRGGVQSALASACASPLLSMVRLRNVDVVGSVLLHSASLSQEIFGCLVFSELNVDGGALVGERCDLSHEFSVVLNEIELSLGSRYASDSGNAE